MKTNCLSILSVLMLVFMSESLFAQHCITFDYDDSGNRSIRMVTYGCDKETYAEVDETVSTVNEEILLYPNPTDGALTLHIQCYSDNVVMHYFICDIVGGVCRQGRIISKDMNLDVSGLPSGTYVIHVNSDDFMCAKTIVKI